MADLFLDWGDLSTQNQALTDTGGVSATVETGGVAVDISFAETEEGASAKYVDFLGYVEAGEPFDPNSNLKLFGDGQASVDNGTNTSVTTLDFRATDDAYADSVQNVSFRLSDVDFASTGEDLNGLTGEGFQDIVTILAYDADGNAVPVTITSSGAGTVSGDTATGTTTTNLEDADGAFLVNIAGPVSRIEILYDNGGLSGQAIMVSDVHFSTVDPVVDLPPVANDDLGFGDEDTAIVVNVLGNDSDPEGQPLTVTSVTDPANGTVSFTPEGELTYTPNPDFNGTDIVTYTVTDPTGLTDTATVTFTVDPVNDAPVAVDDELVTDEDTPLTINVLGNDSDPEGQPITVVDATDPANGTISLSADGTLTYTPNPDFNGTDEMTYTIADADGVTSTATVFITVNPTPDAPVAEDDEATGDEDTPIVVNVLDNDVDPDGDPLTVTDVTEPANGTVTFTPEGEITYTPDPDFTGTDTVTYTVTDPDGLTDTATVTFTVDPTPDAPVAEDDALETDEDAPLTINVLGNDSDPDGQPLEVTDVTQPANGTVTVTPEGELTYTPNPDFNGTEEVTYTVTDPDGLTDTATVFITVNPTPDAPVAEDDEATGDEDTPIVVNVLDNDVDPDGDPLTVTEVTEPTNGTVTFTPEGEITYTPDPDFTGEDTVTYTVTDPDGLTDTATVTFTVDPTPDAPVAEDDALETDEDAPLTINVLGNDSDPDGQPLEVTDVTQPANGTVTVTPEGELTYTPNPDFNGTEEVTYTVTDPDGLTDTATVFITVNPTPDAPVAEDDSDTTDFNTPITIEVLGNDSDPDGDTLTVTGITQPTNGSATFTPEGEITYTPDIGFTGTDTLTYDITDGNGGTDTATVTIFVDPADAGRIDVDVFPVDPADQALDPLDGFDQDPDATDDLDSVVGTDGDDAISTGDDADTIIAGDGADTLEGGIDDDLIDGGAGDDLITDVQGSDTILGGDGNDTITAGIDTFSDYENDDPTFPLTFGGTTFTSDPNTDDGRDSVDGGAGDDVISTGDDADTIVGGLGDDTVDGGIDDDFISGGDGADSLIGGHGSDTIFGEEGDDIIDGSNVPALELTDDVDPQTQNDRDLLDGGDGNDSITGGDDDDTLLGGAGNDTLDGGIDDDDLFGGDDADTLIGGEGNDTLDGGAGADSIDGGADRDVFLVNSAEEGAGDTIQGGFEGDDFDVLNLSGAGDRGIDWRIVNQTPDDDGPGNPSNGIDGTVEFLDATTGAVTGSLDFFNIEQIVPCFTPGTLIATPQGERLVEELREGDRIITRDNGIQEIRWAGRKDLTGHDLARKPHMRPILIQAGSLGNNLPEHDLLVSPNHRILVNNDKTALYFEETEVLAAAKHLVGLPGVTEVGTLGVSYIHFMFDRHEVVLSNGAWSESFQPGDYSLKGIGNAQRNEILELFPELEHADGLENYAAARRSLKKHEARLLVK